MKRLRYLVLLLIAAAVFVRSGQGCAFSDDEDTPSFADPDSPYSAFLDGKLGVISGQLRVRHLVVAYNILSGRGLTPGERKAAIDVDRFYNYNGGVGPEVPSPMFGGGNESEARAGLKEWMAAAPNTPTRTDHTVPGEDYESFSNCLDDAYVHAARRLTELRSRYGKPVTPGSDAGTADTPEIGEWIAGQVAVFSNCSDEKPPMQFINGKMVQGSAPASAMPSAVPANAPLWLRQERAYQVAAADFYAVRYDKALDEFKAVAADTASPNAKLARYVAARTLIRRATVPHYEQGTPAKEKESAAERSRRLAAARDALQAIVADRAMADFHAPAQHLLDYVMVRLDPAAQAEELARRLTAPQGTAAPDAPIDMAYRQNVIDLTYAFPAAPLKAKQPLLRWMSDIATPPNPESGASATASNHAPAFKSDDAVTQWQSTKQPQWLVATLLTARPGTANLQPAIAAARTVPQDSPAWATVTYNRLRLAHEAAALHYEEVASLMPFVEKTQPRSAINLFADLESGAAPTLEAFLKTATRITPRSIQQEPGEGYPARPEPDAVPVGGGGSQSVLLCNVPVADPETPHLDAQTAAIFNERMPLYRLRDAALSPELPGNVRFTLAHMAWTRAVLLDQPAVARALSPYLATCQPAFKEWLTSYDAASTPDSRHVAGLMALMRFTSTNPVVSPLRERDFAAYDSSRDNWWCDANVPYEGETQANPNRKPMVFSQPLIPRGSPPAGEPDPPFLTPADQAEADKELAELNKVGDAGDYFARQALAWVKTHPDDSHNPDLLGFAMRAVRNACRSNATKELNHQLFDTLHRKYPQSTWAERYKTWE